MTIINVVRSKRKTIAMYVPDAVTVQVRAPSHTPQKIIDEFLQKHRGWIIKQQTNVKIKQLKQKKFVDGEEFAYLGQAVPLKIHKIISPPLSLCDGSFNLSQTHLAKAKSLFISWYKKQAAKIITERTKYFAEKYDLKYKGLRVTDAKTRWGSCSRSGKLSFSLKLVMAPLPVVDYVVIHELSHTIHHNHSQRFWETVATFCPDYKEKRKWLKIQGHTLSL